MSATLGRHLDEIRDQVGGPGTRILLTTLGQLLSRRGIDVKTDVGMKLTDALRSYPGLCEIEGREVVFLDGPAEATQGAIELPSRGLRPDLWKARVSDREGVTFWMDLDDTRIHAVEGRPGPPDPDQDWRYLQVPTIPTDEQLGFVISKIGANVDTQVIEQVRRAGHAWQQVVRQNLPAAEVERVLDERREWVVDRTLPWLKEHDIDERRVVSVHHRSGPRHHAPPPVAPGSGSADALRERVMRCVRQMTLAELAELRIPARFLLD